MGIFSIFSKHSKNTNGKRLPWHYRPSVFEYIKSNLDNEGKLTEAGNTLPDEERRYKDEKIRWAPGALDGVFGHHVGGGLDKEGAEVAKLVKSISKNDSLSSKVELYNILFKDNLIGIIDPAFEKIVAFRTPTDPYLHSYARRLAFESPDRGPVKFGISLLGLIRDKNDIDKIIILGKHEEFTLFSIVAITNTLEDPEKTLWELAKYVNGWGRIHIVERLAGTHDPEIKKWFIREGYKNSIMYEYLAYACAVAGGLKGELSKSDIDDELLNASGDIIEALISGGPAQNMDDYEDGAEAVRLYVKHIYGRAESLGHFLTLSSIRRFLENEEADWDKRREKGWTQNLKSDLLSDLDKTLSQPKWRQLVLEKQNSSDDAESWQADQAASVLGIDLWDIHWKRLNDNPADSRRWYNVMKNANEENIDRIIALAIDKIPLDQIATGPADELGTGNIYNPHSCLDFVLQDLDIYPGKGFELIKAGLRSPVTRNRNMAIKALSAWWSKNWPKGTRELLKQAVKEEPNEGTRNNIIKLFDENT